MVQIRNDQGALLSLPLGDVSSGIVVQNIDGLDPVQATLVSSSFAQLDGEQYHSARRAKRNIKLRFGLEPMYGGGSVRDIRKRLYNFFMPKSSVELTFQMDDGLSVNISGRVETCETPMFVREPTIDVSLLCFNPDFYDPVPVQLTGSTTDLTTETLVTYDGSVESGIKFVLNVNRTLSEFTLYHRPPDGSLRSLDFAAPLSAGDVLTISTVPGAKGATLLRANTTSSILYGISPYSNWIALQPGENHLRAYAVGAGIPYTIEYTDKYGGL